MGALLFIQFVAMFPPYNILLIVLAADVAVPEAEEETRGSTEESTETVVPDTTEQVSEIPSEQSKNKKTCC